MRRVALATGALALLAAGLWWAGARQDDAARQALPIPGDGTERIVVEVRNGTSVDGLARRVTRRLRRRGIDVVYFGTAAADTHRVTLLLVRRGDTTAAVAVRDALGVGAVRMALDPRLLLDVSVLLGADMPLLPDFDP